MYRRVSIALLLFLGCAAVSWALVLTPDQYTTCPGSNADVKEVSVTPCDGVPCKLPQGSTATIRIQFTPKSAVDSLDVQVFGIINKAEVPFRGISRKGCDTLTDADGKPACPITDLTKTYTYEAHVEVKPAYPPLNVDIKFKLGPEVICLSFPAKITKSS